MTEKTRPTEADRLRLIAEVDEAHKRYPQYAGYWDGWTVTRTARVLKHRGMQIPAGQIVLVKPDTYTARSEGDAAFSRYPDRPMATDLLARLGEHLRHRRPPRALGGRAMTEKIDEWTNYDANGDEVR